MSAPSSGRRSLNPPSAADRFLAALAAGLPPGCPGGSPVIVGVSGGADSVGLLLGLSCMLSVPILVAHAEHDLRAEAADDRAFVVELAAELGLPCDWRRLAVRDDRAVRGEGLEARARRLRYAFLAEVAHARGGRHVLVAHTADDQAETILHRILRGTGLAGVGGMRRARGLCDGVALVRPLLAVPRAEVRSFLRETGREWREDATNADTARARNFLRHQVLHRCLEGPYPAATDAVVRLGQQAAMVAGAMGEAANHILSGVSAGNTDGSVVIRSRELTGFGDHLLAELCVALWLREGWPRRDMTASHYAAVASLLAGSTTVGDEGRVMDLPGSLRATAEPHGRVRIGPTGVSLGQGRPSHP